MAIVTWATMERYFVGRLPEIPVPVLHAEILKASRIFYTDTRAWRDATPRTIISATVVDQAAYTVTGSPTEAELVGVCEAWANDDRLIEVRNEQTVPNYEDNLEDGPPISGTPTHIRVSSTTQVRLLPTPNATSWVVKAALAYRPTLAATGIDDSIFYEHYEAIVEQTVATAAMHRGQKWSDPMGAQVAMKEYNRLALEAGSRAGSVGRRIRTKTHIF